MLCSNASLNIILSPPPLWGLESLLGLKDRASISACVDATKQTDRQTHGGRSSQHRRGSLADAVLGERHNARGAGGARGDQQLSQQRAAAGRSG